MSCKDDDILKYFDNKPQHLELIKHEKGNGQIVSSVMFRVPGKYAIIVEEYLINTFNMGALVFVCCGWEPKDGKLGTFNDNETATAARSNIYYQITMYSDETLISDKARWCEIPCFYVIVEGLDV